MKGLIGAEILEEPQAMERQQEQGGVGPQPTPIALPLNCLCLLDELETIDQRARDGVDQNLKKPEATDWQDQGEGMARISRSQMQHIDR